MSMPVSPSTSPPRSVTAIRVCVVSTAAARTRDCEVLNTRLRRRRPPVASLVSPSTIMPGAEQGVEPLRDGHPGEAGDLQDVPRVVARPCRISSRMSPGPVGTAPMVP